MKKKYLNIILLIAVGVVWYLIIDRLIDHFKTDDNSVAGFPQIRNEQKDLSPTDDSFFYKPLTFQNKSPFVTSRLKESPSIFTEKPNNSENRNKQQSDLEEDQILNEIKYIGLIKNPESKEQIGLLEIRGQLFQVKEDSMVSDSIKISSINQQNIIIQISNSKNTIFKAVD